MDLDENTGHVEGSDYCECVNIGAAWSNTLGGLLGLGGTISLITIVQLLGGSAEASHLNDADFFMTPLNMFIFSAVVPRVIVFSQE